MHSRIPSLLRRRMLTSRVQERPTLDQLIPLMAGATPRGLLTCRVFVAGGLISIKEGSFLGPGYRMKEDAPLALRQLSSCELRV